jgi:hypothetical protein
MDRQAILFGRARPDWKVFRTGLLISFIGGLGIFGMVYQFAQPGIAMGVYSLPAVLAIAALVTATVVGSMAFWMATKFRSRDE